MKLRHTIRPPASKIHSVCLASAFAAVLASVTAAADLASTAASSNAPNVVILFADDLGYGDLSCYGHPVIRTPHLDRLASDGMRLTSFYVAAPACSPSRAALLTGRYPLRTGMPGVIGPDSDRGMHLSERTIADYLSGQGYQTMAVGKWHVGHKRVEYRPTSRGFDNYFGLLYSHDMIRPWVQTDAPLELYRDDDPFETPVDASTLTVRYTEAATAFIDGTTGPFFLYLAYSMPHLPVLTASEFRGRSRGGLYGDVIETIDWSAGQVIEALERKGVLDNTLIVFSSDNGPWTNMPPRMLHGGVEYWHAGSQSLLRGSKGTTYEGGMRVPGIVHWPDRIAAGQVSAEMASSLDLLPTIVQATGGELADDASLDGLDLLPFLADGGESPRDEFFYFAGNTLEAVRHGSWKLRMTPRAQNYVRGHPPASSPSGNSSEAPAWGPELFHLDRDPGEKWNMAERHPEIVERLQNRMREFAADVPGARLRF